MEFIIFASLYLPMHMRKTLAAILTCPFLFSCASMLNKGHATITISSEPSGASISVNGQERGITPYAYTYHPDDGADVNFEVRRPGYRSAMLSFRPRKAQGVLFLDALLFQVPYLVDRKSSDLYRVPVTAHTVVLHEEPSPDRTRYLMPVTGVEIGLDERAPLGKLGNKQLRSIKEGPQRELQYPDQLASWVVGGLKGTWMDAQSTRLGTQKGDEAVRRAKVHLRARINAVRATLTGDTRRCNGPVELDLEWRFLSGTRTDSLLHTVTRTVTYHAFQQRPSEVIGKALELGAVQLAEDDALPGRVAEIFGAGLAASKGTALSMQRPTPIPFNGRKEMLSALVKAVVTISTEGGHGSGFLITNDGYLITNEHVVGNTALVKAKFEQGFTLDAQVLKVNKDFDLALLKVTASDLPALGMGTDKDLMLGEELFAIGTPLDAALGQSVSRGILSGRRELDGRTFLQTDVSINPGNSGGPLVDENGHVVGVATMKISGRGLEGLGFAVPISQALEMLNISFP